MTVPTTTAKNSYSGNGSTTAFAYGFKIFADADLQVIIQASTGVETIKTLATHYTVSNAGNDSGGNVTFTAGNTPAAGQTVVIRRNLALTQLTDYVENDPFPAASHENALDRLTMISQGINEEISRVPRFPVTSSLTDVELPLTLTANTALIVNAAGTGYTNGPTTSQISAAEAEAAAAAVSATASANSATASANSATASAASAATAETHAGTQSVDLFNGTGSQTAFTLSATPASENNTSVYISGVYQQKNTYSVSGTTLTFSTAPPSGTGNVEVMHISTQSFGVDPSIGSVTTGAAGSSAAVSITSGGVLSFTIPQGDDGATGSTGSTGATGSTGSTGSTGAAATIAAGTATGLTVGSAPTVTNSGSSSAATFNFGIPVGATGATGSTGAAGAAATIAAGTATGLSVGASPTVTNSGSSSAATFNFGIPVGATGATGSTGATGAAATIAVGSVTTGAAGSSATVTNVGSSSAATFNFAIPQGAAGVGSGDVTGPSSATDNAIARFDATTGKLLQNSTVTVSDAGAVAAGSLTLTTDLAIADGGTGASTAGAARTALGVDAAGTDNSTNVTLAGSLDYLTLSGQEITRGAIVLTTDVSGTLPIANGGTNATSAGAALTALGAAARGANSDITSLTGLTTDLTVAQGGTGAGTFAANGILYGNGTSAIAATAVGTDGHVLTSNGSGVAPTFQAAAGGGASDIDGLSDGMTSAAGKNLSLGTDALAALGTSDLSSTAVGYKAGEALTAGRGTFVGHLAGADLNSWSNTVVGAYSAQSHTGMYNTLVGAQVASAATGLMEFNTIVGANAGDNITTGGNSTIVGSSAGLAITTAGSQALVGYQSGKAITTGNQHTALGFLANITSTTGQGTVCIGYNAQPTSATVNNEVTLGNSSIATLRCQVTSITALSDRRDKKDIVPLELGLDFINSLNPVKFTWDMRDGGKVGQQEAGFIAQELDEAQIAAGAEDYLDIVLKENLDKLEAAPGKLIPVLVRAIQDLSAEVATLRNQVNGA